MIYAVFYLGGDMLRFLVVKLLSGNFRYWIPIDGIMGFTISLLCRIMVKTIVDFTGCMHFRHPYEVGGLYFTVNLFLPLLGLILLIFLESTSSFLFPTTVALKKTHPDTIHNINRLSITVLLTHEQ